MSHRPNSLLLTAILAIPLLAAVPFVAGSAPAAPTADGLDHAVTPAPDDLVGPPWISVEYPANPHHPDTRNAIALVHTYHHGDARPLPLTGRAVGMVAGERVTAPLDVRPTYRQGVYAVHAELVEGTWVLAMDLTERDASVLIALDRAGTITAVRVPGTRRDGWMIPHAASTAEVEGLLRTSVEVAAAASLED